MLSRSYDRSPAWLEPTSWRSCWGGVCGGCWGAWPMAGGRPGLTIRTMLWTRFLAPTLREPPADATAPSHALMLRAGLIRQLTAGVYSYLPLGHRSLLKVQQIIREEMNRAPAVELSMPALQPRELWEATGRDQIDVLLGLDPQGTEDWRSRTVLGPTHEEVITEIARAYLTSYRQLPISLYQIQTKFRGEARPKSGVLRTREFLMMDAYSFHLDMDSLDSTYQQMHAAYCRIFRRCGLPFVPVEADSGAIGGDCSHEFMVLTDAGEDVVVISPRGNYAANLERAEFEVREPASGEFRTLEDSSDITGGVLEPPRLEDLHTPGCPGIDDLSAFLGIGPEQMIKTVVFSRQVEGRHSGYVVACVRGDHEINERKLARLFAGESLVLADAGRARADGFAIGYVGPHVGNGDRHEKLSMRLVIDPDVPSADAITGNNQPDHHVRGFCIRRDVDADVLRDALVESIRSARPGDVSPRGDGAPLEFRKAIEIGHIFKLGTKYSAALKATCLDRNGKSQAMIMGCYGIGVNRLLASAVEAHHDAGGIVWPATIAPFAVHILNLDVKNVDAVALAQKLHDELEQTGLDVLLDDRDERPGVKFNDADLLGLPIRVTIGKKNLVAGVVEFRLRRAAETELLALDAVAGRVRAAYAGLVAELAG